MIEIFSTWSRVALADVARRRFTTAILHLNRVKSAKAPSACIRGIIRLGRTWVGNREVYLKSRAKFIPNEVIIIQFGNIANNGFSASLVRRLIHLETRSFDVRRILKPLWGLFVKSSIDFYAIIVCITVL